MSAKGLFIMNTLANMMGKPKPAPDSEPKPEPDPYDEAGKALANSANTEAGKKFMKNNPFNK